MKVLSSPHVHILLLSVPVKFPTAHLFFLLSTYWEYPSLLLWMRAHRIANNFLINCKPNECYKEWATTLLLRGSVIWTRIWMMKRRFQAENREKATPCKGTLWAQEQRCQENVEKPNMASWKKVASTIDVSGSYKHVLWPNCGNFRFYFLVTENQTTFIDYEVLCLYHYRC